MIKVDFYKRPLEIRGIGRNEQIRTVGLVGEVLYEAENRLWGRTVQ